MLKMRTRELKEKVKEILRSSSYRKRKKNSKQEYHPSLKNTIQLTEVKVRLMGLRNQNGEMVNNKMKSKEFWTTMWESFLNKLSYFPHLMQTLCSVSL